jgi:hypothetical protein
MSQDNDYSEYFQKDYGKRTGTIQYPNGDIYTGEFIKIKEEDDDGDEPFNGIMRYANGDVYEGYYPIDKQGNGIMRYANGDVFEGEWQGCMYKGVMRYANGDVYDGEWSRINEDNKIEGDPTDIEIQLALNTKYGTGIMRYANGDVYDGVWRFDKKDDGIMRYANGDVYDGVWRFDKTDDGIMRYANGDVYKGDWQNDYKEGYGIMQYANGDVYVGDWVNNYKEGVGIMRYADINREWSDGEWRNDEYVEPEREPEFNEGIAFEVHNQFNKHFQKNNKKYFEIISPFTKEDNHYLIQPNIIDHVKNKIDAYIDNNYVKQEKEPLIEKLHAIFERVKNTEYMTEAENRILIGKTIDFVLAQKEDFIKYYLSVFSHDCYHAYSGQDGMSCVKGILERFYLLIGDTAFAVCPDTCENDETYEKLKKLFNKKIDRNELTQEWANTYLTTKEIKDLSVENRKEHYISFMIKKYKEADLWDEDIEKDIKKEADSFEYAFKDLEFGGGKKKKQLKKRRTIKKNKNKKTKKSKFGKRKTRRNNRKSVRLSKK